MLGACSGNRGTRGEPPGRGRPAGLDTEVCCSGKDGSLVTVRPASCWRAVIMLWVPLLAGGAPSDRRLRRDGEPASGVVCASVGRTSRAVTQNVAHHPRGRTRIPGYRMATSAGCAQSSGAATHRARRPHRAQIHHATVRCSNPKEMCMTERGPQYDHIGSKYDEYSQTATLKHIAQQRRTLQQRRPPIPGLPSTHSSSSML